jgi:hypothetical protein
MRRLGGSGDKDEQCLLSGPRESRRGWAGCDNPSRSNTSFPCLVHGGNLVAFGLFRSRLFRLAHAWCASNELSSCAQWHGVSTSATDGAKD